MTGCLPESVFIFIFFFFWPQYMLQLKPSSRKHSSLSFLWILTTTSSHVVLDLLRRKELVSEWRDGERFVSQQTSFSVFFKEHAQALLKESQKCVMRSLMRSISVSVIKMGLSVWLSSLFLPFSAEPAETRHDTSVATQSYSNKLCGEVFWLFVVLKSIDKAVRSPRKRDANCWINSKYFK